MRHTLQDHRQAVADNSNSIPESDFKWKKKNAKRCIYCKNDELFVELLAQESSDNTKTWIKDLEDMIILLA